MENMTTDSNGENWKRSPRCESGACVEVSNELPDGKVGMRATEHPETVLRFGQEQWRDFLADVALGNFDGSAVK
ncbi:MAG TPA: DUF397 domain-containing protein [Candidatus Saccharimonadales bacterium]|nr:DUF397 domain-containing protein [Candidatus Saccharimonadales bacterium]